MTKVIFGLFLHASFCQTAFSLPQFGREYSTASKQVIRSFWKEGMLVSERGLAVTSRLKMRSLPDADCKLLEASIWTTNEKELPNVLLLVGSTGKLRFRGSVQKLKEVGAPRIVDFCSWTLAELGTGDRGEMNRLYEIFRKSPDQGRSWTCLKLIVFSSRDQSSLILDEMHRKGHDDGAVGGLISLYSPYRKEIFAQSNH